VGKSPGGGNGKSFQYAWEPMDRGAWWAILHGTAKAGQNQ